MPPSRQSHYGASFVQSGYQTNAMGQAIPMFAVSNSGPRQISVMVGREFAPHVCDMLGSLAQTLAPGQTAVVAVPPSAIPAPGRAFLHCQPVLPSGWRGRAERLLASYLFKQKLVEDVYADESPK